MYYSGKYIRTLSFHHRIELDVTKTALLITNTLLHAYSNAGAEISLDDKNNIQLLIDGASIVVKCNIPSKKIMLKTTDKRWSEYSDMTYVPSDEEICFSIKIKDIWTDPKPIQHRSNESEDDYIKRVFIKTIQLIPKSLERIEEERLREIERQKEEQLREINREKHQDEYNKLQSLIEKARAYKVASQMRAYIQNSNLNNSEKTSWALNQADWIEENGTNTILDDSDREQLISSFFNEKDYNRLF